MYHCALAVGAAGSFHSRIWVHDAPLSISTTQSNSARTNWIGWLITFTRTSMVTDDTRRIKYVSLRRLPGAGRTQFCRCPTSVRRGDLRPVLPDACRTTDCNRSTCSRFQTAGDTADHAAAYSVESAHHPREAAVKSRSSYFASTIR